MSCSEIEGVVGLEELQSQERARASTTLLMSNRCLRAVAWKPSAALGGTNPHRL